MRSAASRLHFVLRVYSDSNARVITNINGTYFEIKKGVKQGDAISSLIFDSTLEVFRKFNWKEKSTYKNRRKVSEQPVFRR